MALTLFPLGRGVDEEEATAIVSMGRSSTGVEVALEGAGLARGADVLRARPASWRDAEERNAKREKEEVREAMDDTRLRWVRTGD